MNRTKIDWPWKPLLSWNPVVGCKRLCNYCYARKMYARFHPNKDFSKLEFFDKRLDEPSELKKPSNIFVGSMTDICYWEPSWIFDVLLACENASQHTYIFLTKEPTAYNGFCWPEKCWQGLTLTLKNGIYQDILNAFCSCADKNMFLSLEPLLGILPEFDSSWADKIIVGAMTGPGAIKPKPEWIHSIKTITPHGKIYWKDNIRKYLEALHPKGKENK